ncbi:MAG: class I SAM-dependent methyltransferase [Phycisphaerae bacterium]
MDPSNRTTRQYDRCLACGGTRLRLLRCVRGYAIGQCPRCLLAHTLNVALDAGAFYDDAYFMSPDARKGYGDYLALAAALERTNRARVGRLRRLHPAARRLLDVGCGPGFFVKAAVEAGLDACGLEVSEFAAHYGREQLHQRIVTGPIDADHLARIDGGFDLITLWDAIEHLPAPDEALNLLAGRLEPGGVLTLSTGDIGSLAARASGSRWHLYNLPEHLWFFSVPSLQRLLHRTGLGVIDVQREVCWYTARYLVQRLLVSFGRRAARFPGAAILNRLNVPVTLLDIVTVSARKPA